MDGRGAGKRRSGRGAIPFVALLVTTVLTGCIGAVDRDDFEDRMADRSGGISAELTPRAIAALEDRLGSRALLVRSIQVDGRGRTVSFEVQDPRRPENVDAYRFHGRTLDPPTPVQVSSGDVVEATTFRFDEVPVLADVRPLVRRTRSGLAGLGVADAEVYGLSVGKDPGEGVVVRVQARSDRATGVAEFDADGTLLGVTRS